MFGFISNTRLRNNEKCMHSQSITDGCAWSRSEPPMHHLRCIDKNHCYLLWHWSMMPDWVTFWYNFKMKTWVFVQNPGWNITKVLAHTHKHKYMHIHFPQIESSVLIVVGKKTLCFHFVKRHAKHQGSLDTYNRYIDLCGTTTDPTNSLTFLCHSSHVQLVKRFTTNCKSKGKKHFSSKALCSLMWLQLV